MSYVRTRRHTPIIPAAKPKRGIRRVFDNRQLIEKFCQWLQAQHPQGGLKGGRQDGPECPKCNSGNVKRVSLAYEEDSTAPTHAPESVVSFLGGEGPISLSVAPQQQGRSRRLFPGVYLRPRGAPTSNWPFGSRFSGLSRFGLLLLDAFHPSYDLEFLGRRSDSVVR